MSDTCVCVYCDKVYREAESTSRSAPDLFCSDECEKFRRWEDEDNLYWSERDDENEKP